MMVAFTLAVILKERPDDFRWGTAILVMGIALYLIAKPRRGGE